MSEEVKNNEQPTAQPETQTQPQAATAPAATVDIDSIVQQAAAKAEEVAEKRAEGAFKSMLQQSNLDPETINKMTAEWKAQQQTPEQIAAEKDQAITTLQSELETERAARLMETKTVAAEKELTALGVDLELLPLVMADVSQKLDGLELDGRKFKDSSFFAKYKEQHPKAFVAEKEEEEQADPPPRVVAEINTQNKKEERTIKTDRPHFF